jgi:hypothetical protein
MKNGTGLAKHRRVNRATLLLVAFLAVAWWWLPADADACTPEPESADVFPADGTEGLPFDARVISSHPFLEFAYIADDRASFLLDRRPLGAGLTVVDLPLDLPERFTLCPVWPFQPSFDCEGEGERLQVHRSVARARTPLTAPTLSVDREVVQFPPHPCLAPGPFRRLRFVFGKAPAGAIGWVLSQSSGPGLGPDAEVVPVLDRMFSGQRVVRELSSRVFERTQPEAYLNFPHQQDGRYCYVAQYFDAAGELGPLSVPACFEQGDLPLPDDPVPPDDPDSPDPGPPDDPVDPDPTLGGRLSASDAGGCRTAADGQAPIWVGLGAIGLAAHLRGRRRRQGCSSTRARIDVRV